MVLTVHDVIPLMFDDGWPSSAVARFRRQLQFGLRQARAVITVSEHTKGDLIKLFDIDPEKVHVIYWGVDPPPPEVLGTEDTLARLGIRNHFVIAFGGGAHRKNTDMVLRAFSWAAPQIPNLRLVLLGVSDDKIRRHFSSQAERLGIGERVTLLGFVTDDELEIFYRRALCLLYISLYEGFGLPLLEAMSRGLPIIASNRTSIPEVTGAAAVLVDPLDVHSVASALVSLANNPIHRAELANKGYQRAAQFSWHRASSTTIKLFEALVHA
jgi:glycosyltransferase involved in cell wall biosynthesis